LMLHALLEGLAGLTGASFDAVVVEALSRWSATTGQSRMTAPSISGYASNVADLPAAVIRGSRSRCRGEVRNVESELAGAGVVVSEILGEQTRTTNRLDRLVLSSSLDSCLGATVPWAAMTAPVDRRGVSSMAAWDRGQAKQRPRG
jgi:hypothetical protein